MAKKISIELKEGENPFELSIHPEKQLHEETHVYLTKSKTYFLKEISRTKKGNIQFSVIRSEGKQNVRKRKNFNLWNHNPNLYTYNDYLESDGIFKFKKLLMLKRKVKNDLHIPRLDKSFHFPDWTENMLLDIIADTNVMLSGMPGTGKSTIIQQLGARLNIPVYRIQCSGGATVESFIGGYVPSETGARWEDGFVTKACREGAWVILDEYDAITSNVRLVLQGILEQGNRILSISDKNEILTRKNGGIHSGFRIFATGNTLGAMSDFADLFGGTSDSNMASLSRWNTYIIDYLTDAELYKVLRNNIPSISRQDIRNIVEMARKVNDAKIPGVSFNTRVALAVCNKLKYKIKLGEALKPCFLNHLGKSEYNRVMKVIGGYYL